MKNELATDGCISDISGAKEQRKPQASPTKWLPMIHIGLAAGSLGIAKTINVVAPIEAIKMGFSYMLKEMITMNIAMVAAML